MASLTVDGGDSPYTDIGRTVSPNDVRSMLQVCRMGRLLERIEPRTGATRLYWLSKPTRGQLERLEEKLDESAD